MRLKFQFYRSCKFIFNLQVGLILADSFVLASTRDCGTSFASLCAKSQKLKGGRAASSIDFLSLFPTFKRSIHHGYSRTTKNAPGCEVMRFKSPRLLIPAIALFLAAPFLSAQDLYDETVVRDIELTFSQANWWSDLYTAYQNETYTEADVIVEGAAE